MFLTPEELIAGGSVTCDVEIPVEVLRPGEGGPPPGNGVEKRVKLRPLTVKDVQLIAKAARDDGVLTSVLMIQKAMVEPRLKQNEIAGLHSGLVGFLVDAINRISGLRSDEDEIREVARAPIVQAFFVLAKEFHWTPDQVKQMTVGQILSYLEMINRTKGGT